MRHALAAVAILLTGVATLLGVSAPHVAATTRTFHHVWVIVMENKGYGSIIGSASAPYINRLAKKYGLATAYYAIRHPSEPNYFALWSGSTRGATTDGTYNFTSGVTLGSQLEAAGKSWHVAAQNVPSSRCYTGSSASGGEDGTGTYVRKHEPAISWTAVSRNATRCRRIADFTHFGASSGQFWLIVPNLCNDMHSCSVSHGDAFLKTFVPKITSSSAFADRGVLFITWDEGSTNTNGGGRVATLVVSPMAKAGYRSSTPHTHYSLLRTIEVGLGVGCVANTCNANTMFELFN